MIPHDGAPSVAVPVPREVDKEDAHQVGAATQGALREYAAGDVTLGELTRSPEDSLDLGATAVYSVILVLMGAVFKPLTDVFTERSNLDNRLTAAVHVTVVLLVYLGAWAAFHRSYPSLPQDPLAWVLIGLGAAGLGGAGTAVVRSRRGSV